MSHLLGIDIGTSGTKTLICDHHGKVLATANAPHTVQSPKPGWSEQDPVQWWQATCKATKTVLKKAGVKADAITGLGLSGQMHGSVFLGDDTTPLRPALLWNDQRTGEQCDEIEAKAGGRRKLINMVGNPALTGFTAPKILWVRKHEPKVWSKTKHILLPKDYIRLCMTGEYATEVGDASGTLLLDVKKRTYNTKLLSLLQIDCDLLADVYESHEVSGTLTRDAARRLGLKAGTPVVGGSGDQPAGAVGNGIVASGIVSASLGTSGVMFAHADEPTHDPQGRVHTMCSAVAGKWCVFGCMLSAAGSYQWAGQQLAWHERDAAKKTKNDQYVLMDKLAAKAPAGSEGLLFMPYLTGERCPYPDPHARGGFVGITARHAREHMFRAVLEGVTFGMADQLLIMRDMGIKTRTVRLSGGGAKSPLWQQMQADIYGNKCAIINSDEGPAYGVAILAGVGTGVWKTVPQACKAVITETKTFKPDAKAKKLYAKAHAAYRSLYPALKDVYPTLGEL